MAYDAARSRAETSPSVTAGSLDKPTCRRLCVALRSMYKDFEKENLPKRLQELAGRLGEKEAIGERTLSQPKWRPVLASEE